MVSRHLAIRAAIAALLLAVLVPAAASAANRRVAISDYRWSQEDLTINLGEHVTWYWTGPDTMHSVTGNSPNAAGLDSDPDNGQPNHKIGDSFRLDFSQPGTYKFRCKLHSTVNGTVTVTAAPGDPTTEPDPVPQSNVDLKAPLLSDLQLAKKRFRRPGTHLRFSLGERARLSADFYRYDSEDRRRFAGYANWQGTVGFNSVPFGGHREHFRPRPGRYLAITAATDHSANTGAERRVRFVIRRR